MQFPKIPKAIIALMVFAVLVVAVPPLVNEITAQQQGTTPVHLGASGADGFVYENYIEQVKEGRWSFEDRMTTEPQRISIINIFWLLVGLPARAFGLQPWLAVLLAGIILAPLMVLVLWFAAGFVFPDEKNRARATWFVVLFGGIGVIPGFPTPASFAGVQISINSLLCNSPHMMASMSLLILAHLFFYRWTEAGETRQLVKSAACGVILLQFHPYFAPVIAATSFVWLLVRRADITRARILKYLALGLALAIPIAYHAWTFTDAFTRARYATNITPPPGLMFNLSVSIIPLVFAGYGAWTRRKERFTHFALVWFFVGAAMTYLPVPVSQRFLESLVVPLALFAYIGVRDLIKRTKFGWIPALACVFGGFAFIGMSTERMMTSIMPDELPRFIARTADWPQSVFAGDPGTMLMLVSRTHHFGYDAHWSETIDYVKKKDFIMKSTPTAAELAGEKIDFLVVENKNCPAGSMEQMREGRFVACAVYK